MNSEITLTITEAAKRLGVTVKTLQRWDREGKFVSAARTSGNHRLYLESEVLALQGVQRSTPSRIVAYCRVSSPAQKTDLVNQKAIVADFCAAKGLANVEFIEEIGGGMNMKRKKFVAIMDAITARQVKTLVVAHKDRLARFGFDWFSHHCEANGCELLVLNQDRLSPETEMVEDLMTIVHCFSSRLYGLRNYKKTLEQSLKAQG
jgi:excisionase family DNA binding protein